MGDDARDTAYHGAIEKAVTVLQMRFGDTRAAVLDRLWGFLENDEDAPPFAFRGDANLRPQGKVAP